MSRQVRRGANGYRLALPIPPFPKSRTRRLGAKTSWFISGSHKPCSRLYNMNIVGD